MADIFKNGILYMDDLHNSDIFNDILIEQDKEIQMKKIEEEKLKKEKEREERISELKTNSNKCFLEVFKKLESILDDEFLFNEDNQIICSNGYIIEIIEEKDNSRKINLKIPK